MRRTRKSSGRAVWWAMAAAVTLLSLSCTACATRSCKHCPARAAFTEPQERRSPPYGRGVVVGRSYDYDLVSSCGDVAVIDGRYFSAAHTHAPWEVPSIPALSNVHGKMTLEDPNHARFVADQGWVYDFVDATAVGARRDGCQ